MMRTRHRRSWQARLHKLAGIAAILTSIGIPTTIYEDGSVTIADIDICLPAAPCDD